MEFLTNNYIVIGSILLVILVLLLLKKGRFFLKNSLLGVISMILVNVCAFFTNFTIGVNILTVCTAIILGLPGTILMTALKFL